MAIIVIALLFIPTYLAVYFYVFAQSKPVRENSVYALDLVAPDGVKYSLSADNEIENETIDLFLAMNSTAKSTVSLPRDLEESDYYTAVYYSYDLQTEYKYYFSRSKPSNSYYTDNEGRAFRIDATYTIAFLDGDYSSALYSDVSVTPVMKFCGNEITPNTLNWHYYSYSTVSHSVAAVTSGEILTLSASYLEMPISFSLYPDSALITVDTPERTLFDGTVAEFADRGYLADLIKEDTLLSVSVSAEWNESTTLRYGGNAVYNFNVACAYDPPAIFRLGENSIEIDEFVILTAQNVKTPEDITFSSDPSIHYEPVFYRDGEYLRAVIPVSSFLGATVGRYTFSITCMDKTTDLILNVSDSTHENKTRKYNYSGNVDLSARTDANLLAFSEFINSVESSETPYFTGSFLFDDLGSNRARFGDTINNGNSSQQFKSRGIGFVSYSGDKLKAVNNGVVTAVGNTKYGGLTVVVDHGWGIRSVYYCIKTAAVSAGDIVLKGETVGTGSAAGGYTDGITAYIELWVNNTAVSYYPLLDDGRTSVIVIE